MAPIAALLLTLIGTGPQPAALAASDALETPGVVEVLIREGKGRRHAARETRLRTRYGVRTLSEEEAAGLEPGRRVLASLRGGELRLRAIREEARRPSSDYDTRAAFFVLRYRLGGRTWKARSSPAEVRALLPRVRSWIREVSYGKASFEATVFGPFTVSTRPVCDLDRVLEASLPVIEPRVDLTRYNRLVFVYPDHRCDYAGVGTEGYTEIQTRRGPLRVTLAGFNDGVDLSVAAHELGHNLGADHASTITCWSGVPFAGRCGVDEYADFYDVMGMAWQGHYNNYNKERIGWLDAAQEVVFDTAAPTARTVRLAPVETAGGVKLLRVPFSRPDGKPAAYVVEYRRPIGSDRGLDGKKDGALIRVVYGDRLSKRSFVHSHLLRLHARGDYYERYVLRAGQAYRDPRVGFRIETLSLGPRHLDVRVSGSAGRALASGAAPDGEGR